MKRIFYFLFLLITMSIVGAVNYNSPLNVSNPYHRFNLSQNYISTLPYFGLMDDGYSSTNNEMICSGNTSIVSGVVGNALNFNKSAYCYMNLIDFQQDMGHLFNIFIYPTELNSSKPFYYKGVGSNYGTAQQDTFTFYVQLTPDGNISVYLSTHNGCAYCSEPTYTKTFTYPYPAGDYTGVWHTITAGAEHTGTVAYRWHVLIDGNYLGYLDTDFAGTSVFGFGDVSNNITVGGLNYKGYIDEISFYGNTSETAYNYSTIRDTHDALVGEASQGSTLNYVEIDGSKFYDAICVESTGSYADYLCNSSIWTEAYGGWQLYCDVEDLIYCDYGCINTFQNQQTGQFYYYSYTKTCNELLQTPLNYLKCTPFWIAEFLGFGSGTNTCLTADWVNIPSASCSNYQVWDILEAFPTNTFAVAGQCREQPDLNEGDYGACNIGATCSILGAKTCFDNRNDPYKCTNVSGCFTWVKNDTCSTGESCVNGECYAIPTSDDDNIGRVTEDQKDLWDNFLGIDTDSGTNRFLIAILSIVICGIIGVGISFAVGNASGSSLPLFLSGGITLLMILLPFFYFLYIGFIPFWVLLLIIIIGGAIVGSMISGKIIGKG